MGETGKNGRDWEEWERLGTLGKDVAARVDRGTSLDSHYIKDRALSFRRMDCIVVYLGREGSCI